MSSPGLPEQELKDVRCTRIPQVIKSIPSQRECGNWISWIVKWVTEA